MATTAAVPAARATTAGAITAGAVTEAKAALRITTISTNSTGDGSNDRSVTLQSRPPNIFPAPTVSAPSPTPTDLDNTTSENTTSRIWWSFDVEADGTTVCCQFRLKLQHVGGFFVGVGVVLLIALIIACWYVVFYVHYVYMVTYCYNV